MDLLVSDHEWLVLSTIKLAEGIIVQDGIRKHVCRYAIPASQHIHDSGIHAIGKAPSPCDEWLAQLEEIHESSHLDKWR
jgi:hypothetical protein